MSKLLIGPLLLLYFINLSFGLSSTIKSKYPFVLFGDDYGILNAQDMSDEYGLTTKKLDYNSSTNSGMHWKCYKTSGFSLKYWNQKFDKKLDEDHFGGLIINVLDNNGIINTYDMRRAITIDRRDKFIKIWQRLIKNQAHVCIHGHFVSNEIELFNGKKQRVYGWVFNKLKTNKGCSGYFGCNLKE